MAERIILIADPESGEARQIIDRFAETVDIEPRVDADRHVFELASDDHSIDITQTLNDIDPGWPDHLSLGDPATTDRGDDDEGAVDEAVDQTFPASDPPSTSVPGSHAT